MAFASVAAVLAACGGDDGGSPQQAAGGGGDGPTTEECVAEAQKSVDQARAPVDLVAPPSGKLDVAQLAGKKVWVINGVNVPIVNDMAEGFSAAARAVGAEPTVFDGKGEVAVWNQGIEQALAQQADGIGMITVDPKLTAESLKAAGKAGVPVIEGFATGRDEPLAEGVYAKVPLDFVRSGQIMSDWILADSQCQANVLFMYYSLLPVTDDMRKGVEARFAELCPSCKLVIEDIDISTMATTLAPRVEAALRSNPDINYVYPAFDSAVTFLRPAVAAAGRDIPIVSHDGVEANLELVRTGQGQVVDGAFPPNQWLGWVLFDQVARGMLKAPEVDLPIPVRIIDKTNIGEKGTNLFPAFENFEDQFLAAWKG